MSQRKSLPLAPHERRRVAARALAPAHAQRERARRRVDARGIRLAASLRNDSCKRDDAARQTVLAAPFAARGARRHFDARRRRIDGRRARRRHRSALAVARDDRGGRARAPRLRRARTQRRGRRDRRAAQAWPLRARRSMRSSSARSRAARARRRRAAASPTPWRLFVPVRVVERRERASSLARNVQPGEVLTADDLAVAAALVDVVAVRLSRATARKPSGSRCGARNPAGTVHHGRCARVTRGRASAARS